LHNCDTGGKEAWIFESASGYSSMQKVSVIDMLNLLSIEGWELITLAAHSCEAFNSGFRYVYVFRREK